MADVQSVTVTSTTGSTAATTTATTATALTNPTTSTLTSQSCESPSQLRKETRTGLGRHAPRSKTGCTTCLRRKVKCDETKPNCNRCANSKLECQWIIRVRKQREPSAETKRRKDAERTRVIRPLRPKAPTATDLSTPMPTATAMMVVCASPSSVDFESVVHSSPSVCACTSPLDTSSSNDLPAVRDARIKKRSSSAFSHSSTQLPSFLEEEQDEAIPIAYFCSTTSLSPALSTSHIPLPNSLTLTPSDWDVLRYYPNTTMVLEYRKPWEWSKLSYINQKIVPNDSIVMRMMLAISASELCRLQNERGTNFVRKRTTSTSLATVRDVGLVHYTLAVRDLARLLSQEEPVAIARGNNARDRMEQLLPALFFMIEYEVRFGYSRPHLKLHLEGVRSLFSSYEESLKERTKGDGDITSDWCKQQAASGEGPERGEQEDGLPDSSLSFFTSQLLLWISYLEVIGGQGLTSRSLMTQMLSSRFPQLQLDRIYWNSRLAGRKVWGRRYPESALIDDIENLRPLEMLHDNNLLRSRIWQLANAPRNEEDKKEDSKEKIWQSIEETAQRYRDILESALLPPDGNFRRVFHTMRCATSSYFAQILFHRRILDPASPLTFPHITAVSNIVQVARLDYQRGTRYLSPHVWGLLLAGIEMDDVAFAGNDDDRQWILDRLGELRGLHSESSWASTALEAAIRERRGQEVNLLKLFTI